MWCGGLCFQRLGSGCRLVEDTAWHPVSKDELEQWKGTFKGWLFKTFLGSPLKSWASVGHWLIWHFDLSKYSDKQQDRVSTPPCSLVPSQTHSVSHCHVGCRLTFTGNMHPLVLGSPRLHSQLTQAMVVKTSRLLGNGEHYVVSKAVFIYTLCEGCPMTMYPRSMSVLYTSIAAAATCWSLVNLYAA